MQKIPELDCGSAGNLPATLKTAVDNLVRTRFT